MNSVVRLAIILDLEVVAIRYSPQICFLWDSKIIVMVGAI